MNRTLSFHHILMGLIGGLLGAALGFWLFQVIARQGLYAIVLPGAFTGLGSGLLLPRRSLIVGIASAIIGTIVGLLTEWHFAPFVKDESLVYFLSHLHQLRPFTQLLIVAGGILAFWFGMGRNGGGWSPKKSTLQDS